MDALLVGIAQHPPQQPAADAAALGLRPHPQLLDVQQRAVLLSFGGAKEKVVPRCT